MHGCIVIMREPAGPDRLLHHHEAPPVAVVAQVPSAVEWSDCYLCGKQNTKRALLLTITNCYLYHPDCCHPVVRIGIVIIIIVVIMIRSSNNDKKKSSSWAFSLVLRWLAASSCPSFASRGCSSLSSALSCASCGCSASSSASFS